MFFLLVFNFLICNTKFFYTDDLNFNVLKERDISSAFLLDLAAYEDSNMYNVAYLKKTYFSYYSGFSYKNIDADDNKNHYNLFLLKSFNDNNYFGILSLNYSLLKYYKYNNFISLSMQTGKKFNKYTLSLNYFYTFSLNSYLSNRIRFGLDNIFEISKKFDLSFSMFYYSLIKNNNDVLRYQSSFDKNSLDLGLALKYNYYKIKLDLYGDLFLNKQVGLELNSFSKNYLMFGIRAIYSI